MSQALRMYIKAPYGGVKYGSGWALAKDPKYRNCVIWDKGFLAFLKEPGELDEVVTKLVPAYS